MIAVSVVLHREISELLVGARHAYQARQFTQLVRHLPVMVTGRTCGRCFAFLICTARYRGSPGRVHIPPTGFCPNSILLVVLAGDEGSGDFVRPRHR
jgi:hypothetical protein